MNVKPKSKAHINKVQLHVELNEAYATLLRISLLVDAKSYYKDLRRERTFLSQLVDQSDYPPV